MNKWKVEITLPLLTLNELQKIKKETPNRLLMSIFGTICKASKTDEDTRFGYTAYGIAPRR